MCDEPDERRRGSGLHGRRFLGTDNGGEVVERLPEAVDGQVQDADDEERPLEEGDRRGRCGEGLCSEVLVCLSDMFDVEDVATDRERAGEALGRAGWGLRHQSREDRQVRGRGHQQLELGTMRHSSSSPNQRSGWKARARAATTEPRARG